MSQASLGICPKKSFEVIFPFCRTFFALIDRELLYETHLFKSCCRLALGFWWGFLSEVANDRVIKPTAYPKSLAPISGHLACP